MAVRGGPAVVGAEFGVVVVVVAPRACTVTYRDVSDFPPILRI